MRPVTVTLLLGHFLLAATEGQKPGQCPVHEEGFRDVFSMPPQCNNDQQCDGALKCCRNPLNVLTCVKPTPVGDKSGQCPDIEMDWTCPKPPPDACKRDSHCAGVKKCCMTKCFVIKCVEPFFPVVKIGKCPFYQDFGRNTPFLFEASCRYDNQCHGVRKCCFVRSEGIKCVDPVIPGDKSGICPGYKMEPTCPKEPLPAKCSNDRQCDGAKKCCLSDCHEIKCVDPIFPVEKPGKCPFLNDFWLHHFVEGPGNCRYDHDCYGAKKCCKLPFNEIDCVDADFTGIA